MFLERELKLSCRLSIISSINMTRIRERLVASRACEMALMMKIRSNGLSGIVLDKSERHWLMY